MHNHNPDHVEFALELLNELDTQPAVSCDLCQTAIELCRTGRFEESVRCCQELYQLGLQSSDSYLQGLARICLGSVYFALGDPNGDWETAIEHVKDSARKFHTNLDPLCNHNEGVAWLILGRIYESRCSQLNKPSWEDAIEAYRKGRELLKCDEDRLFPKAEEALKNASQKFRGSLVQPSRPPLPGRLLWIVPEHYCGVIREENQWKRMLPGEHWIADPQALRMVLPTHVLQVPSLPYELRTADNRKAQFVVLLNYQIIDLGKTATLVMDYLFPKVPFSFVPLELAEYVLSDHAQSGLEQIVRHLAPNTPSADFLQNSAKLGRTIRERLGLIVRANGLTILSAIIQNPEIL